MNNNEIKIYLKTIGAIQSCQTLNHIKFMRNWIGIINKKGLVQNEYINRMEFKIDQMENVIKSKVYKSNQYKKISNFIKGARSG